MKPTPGRAHGLVHYDNTSKSCERPLSPGFGLIMIVKKLSHTGGIHKFEEFRIFFFQYKKVTILSNSSRSIRV